jgi:hypothetical protein
MFYKRFLVHPSIISVASRLLLTGLCAGKLAAFTVDGIRTPATESGYTVRAVQSIQSSGGQENVLANLHSAVTAANLRLFIGGRARFDNAILLFIDSKAGGVPLDGQGRPFIPNNLIQSAEFGSMINHLGASATEGMRFENGFRPDYAIRIQGVGDFDAPVHRFDLQAGTAHAVGNAVPAIVGGGFISAIRCNWVDVFGNYQDAVNGVEMSLNLPLMGVATGSGTIKVLAMLVNSDSLTASNQTLGALTPAEGLTRPAIGATAPFDFETEPASQALTLPAGYSVSDSDDDGLPDADETNDGIYLSATATGSDPLNPDTDGDSFEDGDEVSNNTALGFASNPNIANYPRIWAPGNFTSPAFVAGDGNEMTRQGTDLVQQYQWQRDYRITNTSFLGTIRFKFTAGGSPAINWGPGPAAGSVASNNNDINGSAPATGFYQIGFDQASLTYTFGRKVFPDSASFLAAYGLDAGVDGDFDGILNENEFAANTDPTRADSDNDGINDLLDPQPLLAVRDIVFKVNMSLQTGIGAFNPAVDSVKVRFFDGLAAPGELALSPVGGGVYTGTLAGVEGGAGLPFGGYKFAIVKPDPNPVVSEDSILNRNFNLGTAHVTQQLAEVFFDDFVGEGSPAYETWAEQFETHPGGPKLNPDKDAYTNYEEFAFGGDPHASEGSLIGLVRDGEFLIVSWNEHNSGNVYYDPEQSPDLTPGSWVFPEDGNFVFPADEAVAPEGYSRNGFRVPVDATTAKFLRIKAFEE